MPPAPSALTSKVLGVQARYHAAHAWPTKVLLSFVGREKGMWGQTRVTSDSKEAERGRGRDKGTEEESEIILVGEREEVTQGQSCGEKEPASL